MKKIESLIEVIKKLIRESEDRILNIRGGKGYSAGSTYPNKKEIKPSLGSPGPYEPDENKEDTEIKPVQISKAFKKEKQ